MAIGGIIAAIVNASDKGRDGKRYLQQALKGWEDLPLPEFEKLIAPYLQSIGQLTPEIYDVIEKGSFRGIQEDPEEHEDRNEVGGRPKAQVPRRARTQRQGAAEKAAGNGPSAHVPHSDREELP